MGMPMEARLKHDSLDMMLNAETERSTRAATSETIISTKSSLAGPPIFVGNIDDSRWGQMMEWLPGFVHGINGSLHRVRCAIDRMDPAREAIECHKRVADSAIAHLGGHAAATYIDLEDNCHLTQRANPAHVGEAMAALLKHPEWGFIHLSRFPAPMGLVNPHVSVATNLTQSASPVLEKCYGTSEKSHAMLCHITFAKRITAPSFEFAEEYDRTFASEMTHVVYPALIQRRTDSETPTRAGVAKDSLSLSWLRDIAFTPWVYTTLDWVNAHGAWVSLVVVPTLAVLCVTNDFLISLSLCVACSFLCWAYGLR